MSYIDSEANKLNKAEEINTNLTEEDIYGKYPIIDNNGHRKLKNEIYFHCDGRVGKRKVYKDDKGIYSKIYHRTIEEDNKLNGL